MGLVEQSPDPGHCWVRFSLRPWPGAEGLWLDLRSRRLGRADPAITESIFGSIDRPLKDVLYLPPVRAELVGERDRFAREMAALGTPVLVQCLPAETCNVDGVAVVYDLLGALVEPDLSSLSTLPAGAAAVWPLITGYTDDPTLWREGLSKLAEVGVECVQGIAAELAPTDRRRLVEAADDRGFEALFHGPAPSERAFAVAVSSRGLETFLARPVPSTRGPLAGNRGLAAVLAMIGELWLRLDLAEARGQAFFRAARWIDRDSHDLTALARDGNLGVVTWLDADSRAVIEELVSAGRSSLLSQLRRTYLEPEPGPS